MKLRSLVCVLLSLLLCASAMAEITSTPVYTYSAEGSYELCSDIDRIAYKKDYLYQLLALDGTPLTDAIYSYMASGHYGHLMVGSATEAVTIEGSEDAVAAQGIISADGAVLVPMQYAIVDCENEHWGIGYQLQKVEEGEQYDGYVYNLSGVSMNVIITGIDLYNLDTGSLAATLTKDDYSYYKVNGSYINIQAADGSVKGYDQTFTAVADPTDIYDFSYAYADETVETADAADQPDSFRDEASGLYGIKDAAGNVVLEAAYDSVSVYFYNNRSYEEFRVTKDDVTTYGMIAVDGTIVLDPIYEYLDLTALSEDCYEIRLTSDGAEKYGIISASGDYILPVEYDEIISNYEGSVGYAKSGDQVTIYSLTAGIIDVSGITTDNAYVDANYTSVLVDYNDESAVDLLIAQDGTVTELNGYTTAYECSNSRGQYYTVRDADSVASIIDSHGNVQVTGYSADEMNNAGTYMLAHSSSDYVNVLFEVK